MAAISTISSSNSLVAPYTAGNGLTGLYQLTDQAIQQSSDASIIASFGSGAATTPTYTAAGLLNSYLQAGTSAVADTAQSNAADLLGSTETGTPVSGSDLAIASGEYGSVAASQSDANATNWTAALKSNPALAYQVVADSQNQGLIGAFSAFA